MCSLEHTFTCETGLNIVLKGRWSGHLFKCSFAGVIVNWSSLSRCIKRSATVLHVKFADLRVLSENSQVLDRWRGFG